MSPPPSLAHPLPLRRTTSVCFAAAVVFTLNIVFDRNAGITVGGFQTRLADLLCLSLLFLLPGAAVLLPAWRRRARGLAPWTAARAAGVWLVTFVAVLVALPSFALRYQTYTDTEDTIYQLRKRFVTEAWHTPWAAADQIEWLQENFSRDYLPGDVYCRMLETRSAVLFEYRVRNYPGQHSVPDSSTGAPPPPEVLATLVANCRRDGPAVRAAGRVREAALQAGDIDRFFAMTAEEESPEREVVLRHDELPADVRAALDRYFAANEPLDNPDRRFTAEVLAQALGRSPAGSADGTPGPTSAQ